MDSEHKIRIFLVDDDAVFLKSLEIDFLTRADFIVRTFSTGEQCVQNLGEKPDVVILDFHLDGVDKTAMNGINTLDKIKSFDPDIPVVILSSQDKIDVAVACMHHNAFDYVVKSETAFLRLEKNITNIFRFRKMQKQLNWYMERT